MPNAEASVLDDDKAEELWDELDKELKGIATPSHSRPASAARKGQGTHGSAEATIAKVTARLAAKAHDGSDEDDDNGGDDEDMQVPDDNMLDNLPATTTRRALTQQESRPRARRLEPDPDINHILEVGADGEPQACVKDTLAIRLAFLHYCGSKMRPSEMQRLLEHGMAGPFMTAPKLMSMCNHLELWQPKGPLSFKVVGSIFSNYKNEEVQGLLYPSFLEVLVDMALEGGVNIAATLQTLHTPKPVEERVSTPSNGKLDKNLFVGGVDDLVAGLPLLRTGRLSSQPGSSEQQNGPPIPLSAPQPRFSRVTPLLHSPTLGRLFTHSQIRDLREHLRHNGDTGRLKPSMSGGTGDRTASSTPQPPGSRPASVSTPGNDTDSTAPTPLPGSLPPKGARPPGLPRRNKSPRAKLLPSISIARNSMLRASAPDNSILSSVFQRQDSETESDTAEAAGSGATSHPLHAAILLPSWSRRDRQSDPGTLRLTPPGPGTTRLAMKNSVG